MGWPELSKLLFLKNVKKRAEINPKVPIIRPKPGITGMKNRGSFLLPNSETGGWERPTDLHIYPPDSHILA